MKSINMASNRVKEREDDKMNLRSSGFIWIIIITLTLLISCANSNQTEVSSQNEFADNGPYTQEKDTDVSFAATNTVRFVLPNNTALVIDRGRLNSDPYGAERLYDRWTLAEMDCILDSIRGTWKVGKYVGFVLSSIYYPDLFDHSDNLEQEMKDELYAEYKAHVKNAEDYVPDFHFSVKEFDGRGSINGSVCVDNWYISPISIILSVDRSNDSYPVFVDCTTISEDFYMDYPVIYIKFFVATRGNDKEFDYEPVTLCLSSDGKIYILVDGAFYSVEVV